jgi:hypothetical protein
MTDQIEQAPPAQTFSQAEEAEMTVVGMTRSEFADAWRSINADMGPAEVDDADAAKAEKGARSTGGMAGLQALLEQRSGTREIPRQPTFAELPGRLKVELTRRQLADRSRWAR